MRKILFLASIGMLSIGAITMVGCSKNDELDELDYNLDVSSMAPMTRSSSIDFESGATQTLGGSSTSPYEVPIYENECMLWAILTIAKNNHLPITMSDGKTTKYIGSGYTAEQAYNYVKGLATSRTYPTCDVKGKPIDGASPYSYGGGEMPPSIAQSIGQQSGILKGGSIYFSSYSDLQMYIQNCDLKSGTYIICSDTGKHAAVGKGTDKKGNIRYSDADHNSSKYKESEQGGGWTLIY